MHFFGKKCTSSQKIFVFGTAFRSYLKTYSLTENQSSLKTYFYTPAPRGPLLEHFPTFFAFTHDSIRIGICSWDFPMRYGKQTAHCPKPKYVRCVYTPLCVRRAARCTNRTLRRSPVWTGCFLAGNSRKKHSMGRSVIFSQKIHIILSDLDLLDWSRSLQWSRSDLDHLVFDLVDGKSFLYQS